MNSFDKIEYRIKNYDFSKSKFEYDKNFTFQENRGYIVLRLTQQFLGDFIEMRIPEYDPDEKSEYLGVNKKVDYKNSKYCFEHKENCFTDNGSSYKKNIEKLIQYAKENNLIPVYAYTNMRSEKNNYIKNNVLHLHGIEIFKLLGIEEKYTNFKIDIEESKKIIVNKIREQFNEYYSEFIV